jgi:hypothetical protein
MTSDRDLNTPIADVVDLARKYTPDQWHHAAFISASERVEMICELMERIARSDRGGSS